MKSNTCNHGIGGGGGEGSQEVGELGGMFHSPPPPPPHQPTPRLCEGYAFPKIKASYSSVKSDEIEYM